MVNLTASAAGRRVYDRCNDVMNVMISVTNLAAHAVEAADRGEDRAAVDLWTRARDELRQLGRERPFGSDQLLDLAETQLTEAITEVG